MSEPDTFLYFGCWGEPGHYLFRPGSGGMHSDKEFLISPHTRDGINGKKSVIPWGYKIDGGLAPKGIQKEGEALVHHLDGWTALSFWDRSVDHRGNSNSTFIANADLDFYTMLLLARKHFPEVIDRLDFPIILYGSKE